MKTIFIAFCTLLLSSCAMTSYMGDQFAATTKIDVFYAEKDVKRDYKVIGHIYSSTGVSADKIKASILNKAKAVGADAVIILGLSMSTDGKDISNVQQAEAIKYKSKVEPEFR